MQLQDKKIFSSYLMAGYECADHINRSGVRVDLLSATLHHELVNEDYKLLSPFNISTVREGIRWGFVEKQPFRYDWDEVKRRIEAGLNHNIQQIWEICHMGIPDDLVPTHPRFMDRFCSVCKSFADVWYSMTDKPLIITPINEIGFLSWHAGDVRGTVPFATNQSYDLKIHLLCACMKAIDILKIEYPDVMIMHTEPVINIVPPGNMFGTNYSPEADRHNQFQYQALDILCGRERPELGGKNEYIDIIGVNFYPTNQWEYLTNIPLQWVHPRDDRWMPLHSLLKNVADRYQKPLVLSETSHVGELRAEWITEVALECRIAILQGVDLHGICIYPAIDRPDWDEPYDFHFSGLWSINGDIKRKVYLPYAEALREIYQITPLVAIKPMSTLPEPVSAKYVQSS